MRFAPKYLWALLILTPLTYKSFSQAILKIDSLSDVLKAHVGNDTSKVDILNQIGFEYWTVDPSQSEKFGHEAKRLSEIIHYTKGQAMANRVIGVSHWSRGDFYKSLSFLFESQNLYRSIRDQLGEANSTMNIGLVYADQQDYGKALESFHSAIQLFEKENRIDRIGMTYDKIGTVYLEKGDLTKAKQYLAKALDIHQSNNFPFGIMEASNRIGLLYCKQGDLIKAKEFLRQSLALAEKNKDQEHIIKNLENLAAIAITEKDYTLAKKYLDQTLPLAQSNHYLKLLRDILKDYKNIYVATNDFQKALLYYERYEIIKDSIFNQEKAAQISNLQLEYQEAQQQQALRLREQEVQLLNQQAKVDKLIRLSLLFGIGILIVSAYSIVRNQKQRFKQEQEIAQRDAKLAKAELENSKLREEELQQSLDFKNKELTSYTVNFIRKNELIDTLREKVNSLQKSLPDQAKELNTLNSLIQQNNSIDRDWEDFKRTFENVHRNFFARLLEFKSDLTQSELRLCTLICLNLSIKEMASLMGISPDSVKTARYRLRKKFNLEQEQNLTDFVIAFTKD